MFVHLINGDGELIAQHDSPPVGGAYPFPIWQPGTIVVDEHKLALDVDPGPGPYRIEVGIYDPDSLERWAVIDAHGETDEDDSTTLSLPGEVQR